MQITHLLPKSQTLAFTVIFLMIGNASADDTRLMTDEESKQTLYKCIALQTAACERLANFHIKLSAKESLTSGEDFHLGMASQYFEMACNETAPQNCHLAGQALRDKPTAGEHWQTKATDLFRKACNWNHSESCEKIDKLN
jgi:hypothetical protein